MPIFIVLDVIFIQLIKWMLKHSLSVNFKCLRDYSTQIVEEVEQNV